jgi:hypothetical protein
MEDKYTSTGQTPQCPYCGLPPHRYGLSTCPNIVKIEYYPDGTIKSIEKKHSYYLNPIGPNY